MNQASDSYAAQDDLPDNLPPVQPPSAGFIFQLFVVPGLIVLAVVVVWALFGRIAAGEQDWHALLQELQSPNNHIRNRAMYGLAQILEQDRRRGDQGQHLTSNTEIATVLSDQLTREFRSGSSSKESIAIQEYLTRAVGLLDASNLTLPPLRQAMEPNRDIEIRKSGVYSIAICAGRALDSGHPLEDADTVQALIETSKDSVPVMRHAATYALGVCPTAEARQQLHVLLESDDWLTSVNAAIALARQHNTDGLFVFKKVLTEKVPQSGDKVVEHFTVLTNTLKAITLLAPDMSEADKKEFGELLQRVVDDNEFVRIRVDAQNTLSTLK